MKYKPEEWINHPHTEMADWDDMHVGFDGPNDTIVGLDGAVTAYKTRAAAEAAGGRAFSASDVSPHARAKLKGILDHYRGMAHPFTTCVRDQVKHGLTKDHAERRCAVIKDLALGTTKWRGAKKYEDADDTVTDEFLDTWLAENSDVHDGLLELEGSDDFEEARAQALREYRFDPNQPRDREGQWVRVAGYAGRFKQTGIWRGNAVIENPRTGTTFKAPMSDVRPDSHSHAAAEPLREAINRWGDLDDKERYSFVSDAYAEVQKGKPVGPGSSGDPAEVPLRKAINDWGTLSDREKYAAVSDAFDLLRDANPARAAAFKYGDVVRTPKGEAVVRAVDGDGNVLVDHPDRGNLRFKANELTFDRSSTNPARAKEKPGPKTQAAARRSRVLAREAEQKRHVERRKTVVAKGTSPAGTPYKITGVDAPNVEWEEDGVRLTQSFRELALAKNWIAGGGIESYGKKRS